MVLVTLAITMPFFMLAFDEFTWHLRFYFLGEDDQALQGISLWRILDAEGMGVPSLLLIGIMAVAILIMYWWSWRHEVDIWRTVSLTLIIYFIIYPKVHYEYFLILFAILTPLLIESKKAIAMLYGIALLSGCTLLIEQRYLDWGVATDQYGLMISLAALCMVGIDVILLFFFKDLLTKKTWLDRGPRPLF
jgi:hypothetical protein